MKREYPNMCKLRSGKRVRFRNGGVSKVREVGSSDSKFYPIAIRLENFHATNMEPWCYDVRGFCGNAPCF